MHRRLVLARVLYYIKRWKSARRIGAEKIPALVIYRGKQIMWNGHHRLLAARLLQDSMRCLIYDFDAPEAKVLIRGIRAGVFPSTMGKRVVRTAKEAFGIGGSRGNSK